MPFDYIVDLKISKSPVLQDEWKKSRAGNTEEVKK